MYRPGDYSGAAKPPSLILADNGLRRSGDHGETRLLDGHAVHMLLHHQDGDEHNGRGDAAEYNSNNAKAATVGHSPLPQCPLRCVVARALMPVQAGGLTLGESLSLGSIDKCAERVYGRFEAYK